MPVQFTYNSLSELIHEDVFESDGKKWMKIGGPWKGVWEYKVKDSLVTAEAHPKQVADLQRQGNIETYNRQRKLIYPRLYMSERGIRVDAEGMMQEKERSLYIEDGWIYFIHGWTSVIAEVFHIEIPKEGPEFDALSRIAEVAGR